MHSLVGCFPVDNNIEENTSQDNIDGSKYYRIEIKLSQIYKRVFYVKSQEEYNLWLRRI